MRLIWLLPLLFIASAQAQVFSSALNYGNADNWRAHDKLFYSSFNAGEQWENWPSRKYTVEPLNLVDQLNLCYEFGGGWNHYFSDCVIEDEDLLIQYLEATEEAERFGFHFSAPTPAKPVEEDLSSLDPAQLDWDNYARWSPEKQLYFSTVK